MALVVVDQADQLTLLFGNNDAQHAYEVLSAEYENIQPGVNHTGMCAANSGIVCQVLRSAL